MAYSPQNVGVNDELTPSLWNTTQAGIAGIKEATLYTLDPTTNETWASLFGRLRTTASLLSDGYMQYCKLRFRPTSASQNNNLIFHCTRFVANSTIEFTSSRLTTDGIVFYNLTIGSSSVTLTQVVANTSGTAVTDLSSNTAQSGVRIMGLNNNE